MFIRSELKQKAKNVLKKIYWKAFLVSLVISFSTGNIGSNFRTEIDKSLGINLDFFDGLFIGGLFSFGILFTILLRIFITMPLEVGGRRFFIKSSMYEDNQKSFTFAFLGKNYGNIVLTMLVKDIQNFLWFLLFIIPGIVKAYAYRMVPYILAENPNIGVKKAIKLSCDMTKGYKFDMFVLDLSFLGWYLLGLLAFGLGVFFVNPYLNATYAELYYVFKREAIDKNYCTEEDLLLIEE